MKRSIKRGLSFGLTSGIITTLGLIVGLNSGTHSKLVILGGILTIAIADAFSDALGMHMSVESEAKYKGEEIWQSTFSTFLAKFFFALTFLIPILMFELTTAIIISIIWGIALLSILSYRIAILNHTRPSKIIIEHVSISIIVIILTHYAGQLISYLF